MAILGLGTDIVEIARIEAVIARSGDRLARRVLSDNEWAIWEAHQQPVRFLAKRFAVKEAAAKAFGTGIRNGLAFNQFEVFNDELGKPSLRLWGEAQKLAEKLGVNHMHVTIADERHYASATVIIERYSLSAWCIRTNLSHSCSSLSTWAGSFRMVFGIGHTF